MIIEIRIKQKWDWAALCDRELRDVNESRVVMTKRLKTSQRKWCSQNNFPWKELSEIFHNIESTKEMLEADPNLESSRTIHRGTEKTRKDARSGL